MIARVLSRAGWQHGRRHPWQPLLAVLGVALGVAVVTAVDLTRGSAERAFAAATDLVVGRATHHLVGGPLGIDESRYAALRRAGIVDAAPIIETTVVLAGQQGSRLRLFGVDPLAEAPFRDYWGMGRDAAAFPLGELMTRPASALLTAGAACRHGIGVGGEVEITAGSLRKRLQIIGLLDGDARQPALAGGELMVVDIATAQETLDMVGRLTRIDLILDAAAEARVRAWLPPGVDLVEAASRSASLTSMTDAFHTNLQALSLMALLVGFFLIYNSQSFMVVQRRRQFGILRALGVTRNELMRLVLGEAAVLGLLGALLGLGLGWLLAGELVGLVTRTINDLYFALSVGAITPDGLQLLKALLLGLGGSLAAALVPAREAARVAPRTALSRADLEARAAGGAGRALVIGLGLAAAGLAVLALPLRSLAVGFAGLFLVLVGLALTTPAVMRWLCLMLGRVPGLRRSLAARLALQGTVAALSRTGVAAAALMLAVATTIGIGVMVGSFRGSVDQWLSGVLRADYYLSPTAPAMGGAGTALELEVVDRLARQPGVEALSHVRHLELTADEGLTQLAAFHLNEAARQGFQLLAGEGGRDFWDRFEGQDAVLVTESYAWHHRVAPGDSLGLRTAAGARAFTIIGVYRDYGSDLGRVAMSRATYDRHWPGDAWVNGIGLYVSPDFVPAAIEPLLARLDREVTLAASREIREASLAVFDRTFTITEVLRVLAAVIAVIGIFSALLAIQLERTRELGMLKAIGLSAGQLRGMVLGETAVVGAVAGLCAVPVGGLLALMLIQVINRRSFGWSMEFMPEPGVLAGGVLMALTAALLAGLYPAARIARLQPARALRME